MSREIGWPAPHFNDLSSCEPTYHNAAGCDLLACGRNTSEHSLVSTPHGRTLYNLVTFSDKIINREGNVWKAFGGCCEASKEAIQIAVASWAVKDARGSEESLFGDLQLLFRILIEFRCIDAPYDSLVVSG